MSNSQRVALVTGGSRGIGAATALALADGGYDVAVTYRNKAARAARVVDELNRRGARGIAIACDMTRQADVDHLFSVLRAWSEPLDALVLNASGGMEQELVASDPRYPWRINHDAQLAMVEGALPLMDGGGTIVFVTSHWAHLYGEVEQLPAYGPVAETKHAGEQALRGRQEGLSERNIRLLVVTGDLVEGTITPKLMERTTPGLSDQRRAEIGQLPTMSEMGEAIAQAIMDPALPTGYTMVVGGALESLPRSLPPYLPGDL